MQKPDDYKIFEDSVHGHIIISETYCREIIDNWMFQRPRRIEQTSMRPIFPSAHHDRFIHSIGVYHVGEKMFTSIQENTLKFDSFVYNFIKETLRPTPFVKSFTQKGSVDGYWGSLKKTYVIACLLHDCGHAPFSHTLESYYYNEATAINDDILTIPLNKDIIKEKKLITRGHYCD
ncbi:MAG: HD domain-containing protein [Tannerellaceae bacterium]|jgi:HD superfamily phosphohydrolase|nr:HD domain-containing protein [Tannerellaceae bacterium]